MLVTNRSRIETLALWAQLIVVLATAMSIAQGAAAPDRLAHGYGWVIYLPLLCVLPAAAAFRQLRAAAGWMLLSAGTAFAGFAWGSLAAGSKAGASLLDAAALTWPLFLATALLFAAVRTRIAREREASLLHSHVTANRIELEESEVCGCIACERIYSPTGITQWIADRNGDTAECPHCGIDAVVGSASGIPITPSVLRRAHERWFLIG